MTYAYFAIETFRARNEASSAGIRARPLEGQGLPAKTRVSCSKRMRDSYPVGTCFWLLAKVSRKGHGTRFLYASPSAKFEVIDNAEAKARIAGC